jgi:hypothetical protein
MTDAYREISGMPVPEELRRKYKLREGITFAEACAQSIAAKVLNGNIAAARELREGAEGRANVRSKADVSGPIRILVRYADPIEEKSKRDESSPKAKEPNEIDKT